MNEEIRKLLKQMTLEEKARLCVGAESNWATCAIPRLGIPAVTMYDGPVGVRREMAESEGDGFNQHNSYPATCFPSLSTVSMSWNVEAVGEMGRLLGEQAQALGVNILLGPGINHKRTPLGGRNFEYFSEDPYLTGQLGVHYVNGLQSTGTACSLKHFFANNTEYNRHSIDIKIGERACREIYLAAFETVIKQARPKTVMSAYNRFDGSFCSENKRLLTDILKIEWGYEGVVISDWGAVHDRVKALEAGCDLEMPYQTEESAASLVRAVQEGRLDEKILDRSVATLLELICELKESEREYKLDLETGHEKARELAAESAVLLKNDGALPLRTDFCVIGELAETPRIQGAGSSRVNPYRVSSPLTELRNIYGNVAYAKGYGANEGELAEVLADEAASLAKSVPAVLFFAGLDDKTESENCDRKDLMLPPEQIRLLEKIVAANANVILVLQAGSVIEIPCLDKLNAVLFAGLGGESGAEALADIVSGKISPSGRLSETFVAKLSDNPTYATYAKDPERMSYSEGIFTGYRYYDSEEVEVAFPFGYGLGYTDFVYENPVVSGGGDEEFVLSVEITNAGNMDAKEVVQLYVGKKDSKVQRPKKELKAFCKIALAAKEKKVVRLTLNQQSLRYYDETARQFVLEKGCYELYLNKNVSENIAVLPLTIN